MLGMALSANRLFDDLDYLIHAQKDSAVPSVIRDMEFDKHTGWLLSLGDDNSIALFDAKSRNLMTIFQSEIRNLGLKKFKSEEAAREYEEAIGMFKGEEKKDTFLLEAVNIGYYLQKINLEYKIGEVSALAFHPEHPYVLAVGHENGLIHVWNLALLEPLASFSGHEGAITRLAFCSSGNTLFSSALDGAIKAWKTDDYSLINTFTERGGVNFFTLSPDCSSFLSGSYGGYGSYLDNAALLWDVESKTHKRLLEGNWRPLHDAAFISGNTTQALISSLEYWLLDEDYPLKLVDTRQNSVLDAYSIGRIYDLAISPVEKGHFATAHANGSIRFWHIQDSIVEKSVFETEASFSRQTAAAAIAYHPNGQELASGHWDNNIRIWQVGNDEDVKLLQGHQGWITKVQYNSTGSFLASSSLHSGWRIFRMTGGCGEANFPSAWLIGNVTKHLFYIGHKTMTIKMLIKNISSIAKKQAWNMARVLSLKLSRKRVNFAHSLPAGQLG